MEVVKELGLITCGIETLEEAVSSSDQASPSLFHIGLCGEQNFHASPKSGACQPLSTSFLFRYYVQGENCALLEDISREKNGAGVSREGAALATWHRRQLIYLEEHELAMRPTLLWHNLTPRMLCVNTHNPTDPSGAKRPPRSASPTDVEGSLRKPLETTRTTGPRAERHQARSLHALQRSGL